MPKPNGYCCLHAMIANCRKYRRSVVEVQIRTGWMHRIAEYGVAAHWYYKEQEQGCKGGTEYSAECLQVVKELEDMIDDPREFMGVQLHTQLHSLLHQLQSEPQSQPQ